jgi:two-component system, cell cycle response regulator
MRVLVAEDEAISRRILESQLKRWGYEVTSVGNGTEALAALTKEDPPRLAILDWMMPEMDGVEVCRGARERGREPYVYILLLTGRIEKRDLILAMEAGADDYVTKPFDVHELEVRLRAGRRIVELQEALIAARETMRYQATHDDLTSLWNRPTIAGALEKELARSRREGKSIAVIMADLDHFKRINDTHGHLVGDTVLREMATRIRAVLRPYDCVGRYGGEEFLVVAPDCDEAAALAVAERLRTCIASQAMVLPESSISISVTLSLGVAATTDPDRTGPEALIRAADGALYQAKAKGRNRAEIAGPLEPITGL